MVQVAQKTGHFLPCAKKGRRPMCPERGWSDILRAKTIILNQLKL